MSALTRLQSYLRLMRKLPVWTYEQFATQIPIDLLGIFAGTTQGTSTAVSTPAWNSFTTYTVGQKVTSGFIVYASILNGNTNHVPPNASWWAVSVADRYPAAAGSTAGEMYMATDVSPPQTFIWYGSTWWPLATSGGGGGGGGGVSTVTATAPLASSGGAAPDISMAAATAIANGYMTSTYAAKLDGIEAGANLYVLPIASAGALGGIRVGTNLSIDGSGILSGTVNAYTLPIASAGSLGGIRVGSGLSIDGSGILSASGSAVAAATTAVLGTVLLTVTDQVPANPVVPNRNANGSMTVTGNMADGASAVGVALNNNTALTNAGAKLLSVQNAAVEKAYISYDGSIVIANNTGYKQLDDGGVVRTVFNTTADGTTNWYGYHGTTALATVNGALYMWGAGPSSGPSVGNGAIVTIGYQGSFGVNTGTTGLTAGSIYLKSYRNDSNPGTIIDTATAYTTQHVLSIQTNGVEKGWFDGSGAMGLLSTKVVSVAGDGTVSHLGYGGQNAISCVNGITYIYGSGPSGGYVAAAHYLGWFGVNQNTFTNTGIYLKSKWADGASAIGTTIDTSTNYVTTGAKLLSIQNNGVEKAFFDLNGVPSVPAFLIRGTSVNTTCRMYPAGSGTDYNNIVECNANADIANSASFTFGISNTNLWATPLSCTYIASTANGTGVARDLHFWAQHAALTTTNMSLTLKATTNLVGVNNPSPSAALSVKSVTADGATAAALIVDTSTTWANTSARLLSLRNNTSEKIAVEPTGKLTSQSTINLLLGNAVYWDTVAAVYANINSTLNVRGNASDGASAVGVILNNNVALTNATSKLLSVQNATVEKFYIDKDGNAYANGVLLGAGGGITAPYTLAGVGDTVPFTINAIAGQTANLQSWQINTVEKVFIDAAGDLTAGNFITGAASGKGLWASDTYSGTVVGRQADGASAIAVVLNSYVNLATTGAKLLSIQNNAVERLSVDKDGSVRSIAGTGIANSTYTLGGASYTGTGCINVNSGQTIQLLINQTPTGTFPDTGRAAGGININALAANSNILFYTHNINNTQPRVRLYINNLGLISASGGGAEVSNYDPLYQLETIDENLVTNRGMAVSQHNTGVHGASFNFVKTRGTRATPLAVANGDYGGFFANRFRDTASTNIITGGFGFRVNGTVGSNSVPTDMFFYTNAATTGDPYNDGTVRMILGSTGLFGLNTTTLTTAGISMISKMADGAAAIGTILDTSAAWSNTGAKLLSVRNNAVEKFWLDKDGNVGSMGGYWGTSFQDRTGTLPLRLLGNMADSGTAVGVSIDSAVAYTVAGSKLLSIRNNAVEKLYVRYDGGLVSYGPTIQLWKDVTPTYAQAIGNSVPGAAAGNDFVVSTYINGGAWTERLRIASTGFMSTNAASVTTAGVYLKSVMADGASAIGTLLDTSTAWSNASSKLLSVRNNNVEKLVVDKDGQLGIGVVPTFPVSVEASLSGSTVAGYIKNTAGTTAGTISRWMVGALPNDGANGLLMQYAHDTAVALILNWKATTGTLNLQTTGGGIGIANDGSITVTGEISSDGIRLRSTTADGATAVGSIINTSTAYTTAGAKLLSIRNNTVEQAYFDYKGALHILATSTDTLSNTSLHLKAAIPIISLEGTAGTGRTFAITNNYAGANLMQFTYSTTAGGFATNVAMTIDDSGNVGVGTTPSQKFHVAGNIYSTGEIYSNATVWADVHAARNANEVMIRGLPLDGAAAVGVVTDTTNTLSTTGAKLLSIRNNTVEKAYVDKDGKARFSNLIQAYFNGTYYLDITEQALTAHGNPLAFNTQAVDALSTTAFTFNNSIDLTIAGAKLLSMGHAGGTKFIIDKDGNPTFGGTTGVTPLLKLNYAGGGYRMEMTEQALRAVGGNPLSLSGSAADGASTVGVIVDNTATLSTAGAKLLSIRNNTVEKLAVDMDGLLLWPDGQNIGPPVGSNVGRLQVFTSRAIGDVSGDFIVDTVNDRTNSTALLSVRNQGASGLLDVRGDGFITTYSGFKSSDTAGTYTFAANNQDSGGPVTGVVLDNINSLTDTGSKLLSIRNATVEKAYLDVGGRLYHGVVWDDVQGPASAALIGASAPTNEAYRDTTARMTFMRHDQDDTITITYQLPHRWIPNTEVRVHLHYIPMVTPAADEVAYLEYSYAWGHPNAELPAAASWTTGNVSLTIPSSGANTFFHKATSLFVDTPTGASESSFLIVRFSRLGTNGADTYTTAKATGTAAANLAILSVDCHYQSGKEGSVSEFGP